VDLASIELQFRKWITFDYLQSHLPGRGLITREDTSVLGNRYQVSGPKDRPLGASYLQQFAYDLVDMNHLMPRLSENGNCSRVGGQIASDDLHDTGNTGQRVTNFVG